MLIVISPAKTLDYETPPVTDLHTTPEFIPESKKLIKALRELAPQDISKLMGISDKLGTLNYDRFHNWKPTFTEKNSKQAILAFKGDVYTGLEADTFKAADFNFAQKHLRILSGLYGLLRPLDLMQPYRLEMGTKFRVGEAKDLYSFWGSKITEKLNEDLKAVKSHLLVNLASNEYFKAVQPRKLEADLVSPVYKDWKNGQYKIISFYAKKARGMMSAFIIRNRITEADDLKDFDWDGYAFAPKLSKPGEPVFTRKAAP
ncbi:peroxide stress protein YaaA [Gilvimarinus sp. F26214L]|uniref:peroxide stress protein YaaA n=1 Tax=Gilvimarinus sp. DZF01 TaxID=3461371 RepID=UPI0040462C2D